MSDDATELLDAIQAVGPKLAQAREMIGRRIIGQKQVDGAFHGINQMQIVWDSGLHFMGAGKDVAPMWYVISCITFDILVAAYIFYKIIKLKKGSP